MFKFYFTVTHNYNKSLLSSGRDIRAECQCGGARTQSAWFVLVRERILIKWVQPLGDRMKQSVGGANSNRQHTRKARLLFYDFV